MKIIERKFKDYIEYGYYQGDDFITHRDDGPAIEYTNGNKYWYINGMAHREDGPATEYANGEKHWCIHGKYHREDGPAIEDADGTKYWYLEDKIYRRKKFEKALKKYKINKICK